MEESREAGVPPGNNPQGSVILIAGEYTFMNNFYLSPKEYYQTNNRNIFFNQAFIFPSFFSVPNLMLL